MTFYSFATFLALFLASKSTKVSIDGNNILVDDSVTYSSASNSDVPGLLFNSRMVQGIYDDANDSTVSLWAYPDTGVWDPQRNTNEFVSNMSLWNQNGLLGFTVGLQGGCPYGYCSGNPWEVSAFNYNDGSLKDDWMSRLKQIMDEADSLGMVPIVQFFYQGQVPRFGQNDNTIQSAIDNVIEWLIDGGYEGFMVDVANECNSGGYSNTILHVDSMADTIQNIQKQFNYKIPIGSSFTGGYIPPDDVLSVSDIILVHGNGQSSSGITNMINTIKGKSSYNGQPIIFNEDDHYDFNSTSNNEASAVNGHASWGYFDGCSSSDASNYVDGYQCPPTNWGINTNRKKSFFLSVSQYTST